MYVVCMLLVPACQTLPPPYWPSTDVLPLGPLEDPARGAFSEAGLAGLDCCGARQD
eukprot:SAG31_NODE_6918_length_1850_cov_2.531125_1_plen_55_part_10